MLAEGFRSMLADQSLLEFVGSSGYGGTVPPAPDDRPPAIVVIDWSPRVSWPHLAALCQGGSSRRVVLLTREVSPEFVFQAREAGAVAVLDTRSTIQVLSEALQRVADGDCVLDIAAEENLRVSRTVRLTRREGQLVTLLSQGLKNKEIATCLNISEGTVKVYLSKLFQKVGAKDRFELALFGLKNLTSISVAFTQEKAKKEPITQTGRATPGLRSLAVTSSAVSEARELPVRFATGR